METNETHEQPFAVPGLSLNLEAQSYLREAGKWANFLGILGFIICVIILIASFFVGGILSRSAEVSSGPMGSLMAGMGSFITVVYILVDILYFFFSLYLYQFGVQIKKGITFADNAHVTGALGKLKSFFKLWGITTIVVLCLYALIFVGAIVMSVSMMHH